MNILNVMTIMKRELGAYFNSAIAYIFIIVFILISVGLYITDFFVVGRADMRSFFNMLPIILTAYLPALTMRLWAEDKRGNTLELLLTFPLKTHELVMGKFLAGLLFYLMAVVSTFTVPFMVAVLGQPDMGPILGSYLGVLLFGSLFLSLGIFISGLCRDQIVAFIATFVACFMFVIFGTDYVATSLDGWFGQIGLGSALKVAFGALPHYASFTRGVIDMRDVLYFLLGTFIFLMLNTFWLDGRMRPRAKTLFTTCVILSLGIFTGFNWAVSDTPMGRYDLTSQKIYTISHASQKILASLKTPTVVKFYVSPAEKMPTQLKTLEQDVIDKLEEIRVAAKGNFIYEVVHMEAVNLANEDKNSTQQETLEVQLEKKGIQPFQVQSIEADQVGVQLVYSAMSVTYKEKPEEIIPQVIPSALSDLEYLLISKIYRMTLDQVPSVEIVAPYEEKNMDPTMAALLAQLGGGNIPEQYREDDYRYVAGALEYSGYRHSRIKLSSKEGIAKDTNTLVVLNPEHLNDRQLYEMNRFLYEGGSILLGVQNYSFDYQPAGRAGLQISAEKISHQIDPLIEPWGMKVNDSFLLDEQSEVINISGLAQLGPYGVNIPVKTPLQIVIAQDGMNPNISITSNLSPIFYIWGSALDINETRTQELGLHVEPLLSSSDRSWTVPAQQGVLSKDIFALPAEGFNGPLPAAVFIEGQFPNNYADRQTLPLWPEAVQSNGGISLSPEELKKKAESAPELHPKKGKLILTGASTIFRNNLMGGGGGHLNFFLNCIDALTLSDDLIKIRSKQTVNRLIRHVSKNENLFWRFFCMFFIPLLLALIGFVRFLMRKRAKQVYLRSQSRSSLTA
ncbi:MAG: hypothetical protein COV74_00665 [Candidatus Omnitrophica bacterium CG11_big_fil_rev_8_21_14_0_20_45_26]|uniref:Uncharacterized protein n=1 Tax=Candidatus Abzuiibacterium crystallinum TaxID=1974748 RepID=A0A2H0LSP9_9BACT|nr:MAG: hypothetical protein COV74_00665 [Candidatus Omnitrophica bacterium CG11_big_fil_rev_8_21_14_0_20_45_26]PIW64199.1 MAG: hypothetical protein COW12_07180 [Candidatus Omnitrophica bacterium CG12_big_fil_rev_8_21_14_0_65_45_16]